MDVPIQFEDDDVKALIVELYGGVNGRSSGIPGFRGEITYRQAFNTTSVSLYQAGLGGKPFNEFKFFKNITTVNLGSFYYAGLSSLVIPEGVIYINMNAIRGNAMYVELPSTLTSINSFNFYQGSYTVKIYATTPPSMGVVEAGSITKLYVPTASVDAYKAADGWSTFASVIEGF